MTTTTALPPPRLAREKIRVTLVALIFLGSHGAWVAGSYGSAPQPALLALGGYVGALGAFMVAVGLGSGWHLCGGHPRGRFGHMVVAAWLLSLPAAVLGVLTALAGTYAATSAERTTAAAIVATLPGVMLAARATPKLLERVASLAPVTPPDAAWVLAPAAALASGTFGALHPLVRFPGAAPLGADATQYAWTGIIITVSLLPLAGWRIARGLGQSGALKPQQKTALLPAVWAVCAVGLGVFAASSGPWTHTQWAMFRGVAGAVLGALGILTGAALNPPRGSGRSVLPGKASRPQS